MKDATLEHEAFAQRLRQSARKAGSIARLAESAGIHRNNLNRYLASVEPDRMTIVKIALAADVLPSWLAFGTGSMELPDTDGWVPIRVFKTEVDPATKLPKERLEPPLLMIREEVVASSFLRSKPDNLVLFEAPEDGLDQTMPVGTSVIFDLSKRDPGELGTYCLCVGGTTKLRHIRSHGLDRFLIKTDGVEDPIEFRRSDLGDRVFIFGKVIVAGQWIKPRAMSAGTLPTPL